MSSLVSSSFFTPLEKAAAVECLCKLITFPTVSAIGPSTGSYVACATYLHSLVSSFLPAVQSRSPSSSCFLLPNAAADSPVVVFKWTGSDPSLPVLLLNCHYDVVPPGEVGPKGWTVDPFGGIIRDGRIYGRGAQDMKCVVVQYVEALRKLSEDPSFMPLRTVVLTCVPDEEIGGGGMASFLSSEFYAKEVCEQCGGVALALDEGLASTGDGYSVFYGERLPWWIEVTATGATGHGSRFIEPTAMQQIVSFASKALAFRAEQKDLLFGGGGPSKHAGCAHAIAAKGKTALTTLGDVTTLNITGMRAGVDAGDGTVAANVVPPTAVATVDIRISPHVPPEHMKAKLDGWCRECSPGNEEDKNKVGGVSWAFLGHHGNDDDKDKDGKDKNMAHHTTATDKDVNPFYQHFVDGVSLSGIDVLPEVFPAATDSRFLRALGIRALGFSPMRRSEIMLHEYDENIKVEVFEEGLEVFFKLIRHLVMIPKQADEK